MITQIKTLEEVLVPGEVRPSSDWQLKAIKSDECFSYMVWNVQSKEALLIDPKDEDVVAYRTLHRELLDYHFLGVIDTHTHADHISIAAQIAAEFKAPLIMHAKAPSQRVQIRVAKDTALVSRVAPIHFLTTPGHTPDSLTVIWGPFIFGGDTLLYGDTGRDDLPGGDPEAHYDSVQSVKAHARPEMIVLPGHDHKGGRASTWATQLKVNSSLTQEREDFVREAGSFEAPAPKLLKKSLFENFK